MTVAQLNQNVETAQAALVAAQSAAETAVSNVAAAATAAVTAVGDEVKKAAAAVGIVPQTKTKRFIHIAKKTAIYGGAAAVVGTVGYFAWKRYGVSAALAVAAGATDVAQSAAETAVAALMA